MNTILKTFLSSSLVLTISSACLGTAYAANIADSTDIADTGSDPAIVLSSEDISFEYVSTVYNGQAQKPAVTVTVNGGALAENTDFTVDYPEDCTNAGIKTVTVKGIGKYSGTFSATYIIRPLNVSGSNVKFSATAEPCVYNGFGQTPEFTLKANGITIPKDSYTSVYSNNINVSDRSTCEFTFSGNFLGRKKAEFDISKAEHDEIDFQLNVSPGEKVVYDLSAILPEGASLGSPKYSDYDFPEGGKPIIAFNELRLTCGTLNSDSAVAVPVIGADNFTDFYVTVYLSRYEKIVPKLVIKPIVREYNGEDVQPEEFEEAGCYAEVNGVKLKGEWIFWRSVTGSPHTTIPYSFTFQPEDERYASVDGIVPITINKITAKDLSADISNDVIDIGRTSILTVSGVPEDRADELKITCTPSDGVLFEEFHSQYQDGSDLRFKFSFPYNDDTYTITASLPEDEFHSAASASCKITVGEYVPPEQQTTDKVTTSKELSEMIASAPMNGFVAAEGMRSVSRENVTAAAAKKLTLEVKLNDTYTWILKTEGLTDALDLDLDTAVIPAVLTDKIGGDAAAAFTVSEKELGSSAELRVTLKKTSGKYASLFYYNTGGTLDYVDCATIEADKTAELKLEKPGKYVVITDDETKLFGDINNDRAVTLSDVVTFLKLYANDNIPSGNTYKFDINADGSVDLSDLSALLKYYVNLE